MECSETFNSVEVQFSSENSFTTIPVKTKGKRNVNDLLISSSIWKKVLLLPGMDGGTDYWRVVGTKANRTNKD